MKIFTAFYQLEANHSRRSGALLKISFPSGVGYADCHPWPELGDLPLEKQLKELKGGRLTPLTSSALAFAQLDARSRGKSESLLKGRPIPTSHFLVSQVADLTQAKIKEVAAYGFTHIKLKVGPAFEEEAQLMRDLFLHIPLKLRLDFNEKLTGLSFRRFLSCVEPLKQQIDFIEDPFPLHVQEWGAIQNEGWRLASDRQASTAAGYPEAASVLIVKPALHPREEWKQWNLQTCIVTSYLGHPLGQMGAAYVASQIDSSCKNVHGLLSHLVYRPTPFSTQLGKPSPSFSIPPGTGFGFDRELEQLAWIPL